MDDSNSCDADLPISVQSGIDHFKTKPNWVCDCLFELSEIK